MRMGSLVAGVRAISDKVSLKNQDTFPLKKKKIGRAHV